MLVKKTVFWVRSPQTSRLPLLSTISPVQLPAVTRFHPLARHHSHHWPCQQAQQPQAKCLLQAVPLWLLCHRLRGHRWILLLLCLAVQFIRAPWGVTLLLSTIEWLHHLQWHRRRISTRIGTPLPAAEPVLIFQLQKSYHQHTRPSTTLTLSTLHYRLSNSQDPRSQRYCSQCWEFFQTCII